MVEASSDVSMSAKGEGEMSVDEGSDVVIKPRNSFSSNALRRAVPQTDLRKKRESLSMSLINMSKSGRQNSRMFSSANLMNKSMAEQGRHQSFNIAKQISFQSLVGRDIKFGIKNKDSCKIEDSHNPHISEADEDEDSSDEKSDPSSSSGDSSDSSMDAAINGEDDSEQALYDKI